MRLISVTRIDILLAVTFFFVTNLSMAEIKYLRLGYDAVKLDTFDITKMDTMAKAFFLKQFAQSLVDTDMDGKVIPSIAKSWHISPDMRTYTFMLFKGIHFHDGRRLTSSDVAYSINLIKNSTVNPMSVYLQRIEEIAIHDDYSLTLRLKSPWLGFLNGLTSPLLAIVPKGSDGKNSIGSGPYLIKKDGTETILEPFPGYLGKFKPKSFGYRIETNNQKDVDLAFGWRPSKQGAEFKQVPMDNFYAYYFLVNPIRSKWKNIENRLALIKILLMSREVITSPNLKNLDDIFPKGMQGFDITSLAFNELKLRISNQEKFIDTIGPITIASPGPIPKFDVLSVLVLKRFGIRISNLVLSGENLLNQLKNADADIFCFGWNSIFGHPDALFLPFYILGINELSDDIRVAIIRAQNAPSLSLQYRAYRNLASTLIKEAFVFPHSQSMGYVSYKKNVAVPKYRFRYAAPLSEIVGD